MEIKRTGLWIGRQAARMCLMVLLVSILAFGLLAASPIDPLQTNVGQTALGSMSPEQIARLRSYWGTDLPPVGQSPLRTGSGMRFFRLRL